MFGRIDEAHVCGRAGLVDHVDAARILGDRPVEAQRHAQELHQQHAVDAVMGDDDHCSAPPPACLQDVVQPTPDPGGQIRKRLPFRKRDALGRAYSTRPIRRANAPWASSWLRPCQVP